MYDYEAIKALDDQFVMKTYNRQPRLFVRGEGAYMWDSEGNRYLDFLAGIAVCQLGHCHPAVVAALTKQANTLMHTSNHMLTPPQALLAQKLCEIGGMEKVFYAGCGTTANETALKIAKKHGLQKRPNADYEIITLDRSFHGRSLGSLSATGQEKYQKPFLPIVPGFKHIPANDIDALRASVNEKTAAVVLEVIQGEGGLTTLTREYVQEARRLTTANDAFLIADEVQSGIGRTGQWFAYQNYDVEPDVVCLAKALGGGMPIGAVMARGRASTTLVPGDHGSTFGGNPIATATALAVLETVENEGLLDNALRMGEKIEAELKAIGDPIIEIRGMGLMRGAVLNRPIARDIVRQALLHHHTILNATDENTLRFVPPLNITDAQIDEMIVVLRKCLAELAVGV